MWALHEGTDTAIEKVFVKASLAPRPRANKLRDMIQQELSNGASSEASGEVHKANQTREFRRELDRMVGA